MQTACVKLMKINYWTLKQRSTKEIQLTICVSFLRVHLSFNALRPSHRWRTHPAWSHDTMEDSHPLHVTWSSQQTGSVSCIVTEYDSCSSAFGNPRCPHNTYELTDVQPEGQMYPHFPSCSAWTTPSFMKSSSTGPSNLTFTLLT